MRSTEPKRHIEVEVDIGNSDHRIVKKVSNYDISIYILMLKNKNL
jgi:hypothetical protein